MTDGWDELLTVALLGTERRDPPTLPDGLVADVVADAVRPLPESRLAAAVAATVVARRSGVRPRGPRSPLAGPPSDERPLLPTAAAERWHVVVDLWPALEPEWLYQAAVAGWRPPADVLVGLLRRHHRHAVAAANIVAFGGSLTGWLVDHVPDLEPLWWDHRPAPGPIEPPRSVVPSELQPLLGGPAATLARAVLAGLTDHTYRWAHRGVLVNLVPHIASSGLDEFIATLDAGVVADDSTTRTLWELLVELATVRRDLIAELEPPV